MNGPDLHSLSAGRFLLDSLSEAAVSHPESFGYPGDDRPRLPLPVEDELLNKRITTILGPETEVAQCHHLQRRMHEILESKGLTFRRDDVYYGMTTYVIAAAPEARLCWLCANAVYLPACQDGLFGKPCTRCEAAPIPAECYVHETQVLWARIYWHVCDSCATDLKGGSHE